MALMQPPAGTTAHQLRMVMPMVLLVVSLSSAMAGIGCRDENGNPVDWFIAIKHPDGTDYSYTDSNSRGRFSAGAGLDSNYGSISATLEQFYGAGSSDGYLQYNDQTPDGKASGSKGHTKGVVAFDSDGGYWLIHSVPRYPIDHGSSYSYPVDEERYGQSFLCLSLDVSTLETVGQQFMYTRPQLYGSPHISSDLAGRVPTLKQVLEGGSNGWIHNGESNNAEIRTKGGADFTSFAKTASWGQDLYAQLVAPHYRSGVLAETWMNGVGAL